MKKYYDLSFSKQAVSHLPEIIRKKRIIAYLATLVRPVEELQLQFKSFVTSVDINVRTQVCTLRAFLNDHFDYYERRIRIKNRELNFDNYLLWGANAGKPMMIGRKGAGDHLPYLLNRKGQLGRNEPDFEVLLPTGFRLSEQEEAIMRSIINTNKLVSKKYIIKHE